MKRKKPTKPYWEMSLEELQEATKQFDHPIPLSRTRPLSAAQRALFERAQRKPARSIFVIRDSGKSKSIKVKLDAELLRRSTEFAASRNMTLSEFISKSLQGTLIAVD